MALIALDLFSKSNLTGFFLIFFFLLLYIIFYSQICIDRCSLHLFQYVKKNCEFKIGEKHNKNIYKIPVIFTYSKAIIMTDNLHILKSDYLNIVSSIKCRLKIFLQYMTIAEAY